MNNFYPGRYQRVWPAFFKILFTLLLGAMAARAADRYVSLDGTNDTAGGYANWVGAATQIQWAVNAATNGETVWISNGTYYCQGVSSGTYAYPGAGNIVTSTAMIVITNSIALRSWSGNYSNTVINGNYPAYTTRVVMAVNAGAVLDGLTITNGWIFDNTIPYTNSNILGGAGVYFIGSLITNCLISGNMISNSAVTINGAGIYLETGKVSHCVIKRNRYSRNSIQGTPGIWLTSFTSVSNCVITENGSDSSPSGADRAGAVCTFSYNTIANCEISKNDSDGVRNWGTNLLISSSIISSNKLRGIVLSWAAPNISIRNCLITGHNIWYPIYAYRISAKSGIMIENCTIANNAYPIYFSGNNGEYINVLNSIVYYNYGGTNWKCDGGTNAVYTNSCITPMPTNNVGLPQGSGNITNEPAFANTNASNYRLTTYSPCVNRGVNQDWMNNAADLEGRKRIMNRIVDIGAYEFSFNGTIFSTY